jgi:ADP-ribosyl-[dinitrogen reductase] hydrolase
MSTVSELDRYLGCLTGLATGDALGTTLEFCSRGSFTALTDMSGGGPFGLQPGRWTDDTSMALCLAHSLLYNKGFDAVDQMNRYCSWRDHGYMSSTGHCFGIGNHGYMSSTGHCFGIGSTVAAALQRYLASGNPFSGSVDPRSAGNGCIMRLAPVPMFFAASLQQTLHFSGESARTTHAAPEALDCTRLFGAQLRAALRGASKAEILEHCGYDAHEPAVRALSLGDYRDKDETRIRGSGYVVESLEAALWCFLHTDDYAAAVLRAANLGDDADTTAAICGQLAGAHYGISAIPARWRALLTMGAEIEDLASRLLAARSTGE